MIRSQRQVHLMAWVILAPVMGLVLLVVLLTGRLEVSPPPPEQEADPFAVPGVRHEADASPWSWGWA